MAIINHGEGIYLDTKNITSFSIKEILVNQDGDKCFALVCYPGPGAGYIVSRYNKEEDAKNAFENLLNSWTLPGDIFLESKYIEPEPKEIEVIGSAEVENVENN